MFFIADMVQGLIYKIGEIDWEKVKGREIERENNIRYVQVKILSGSEIGNSCQFINCKLEDRISIGNENEFGDRNKFSYKNKFGYGNKFDRKVIFGEECTQLIFDKKKGIYVPERLVSK